MPVRIDASMIWQGHNFTFVTNAGFFDCLASPEEGAATGAKNSPTFTIGDARDLVAGRAKDLIEVEVLKAVLATTHG